MPIFNDIETLEEKLQEEITAAGNYSSVDDFVQAYTDGVMDAIGDYELNDLIKLDDTGITSLVEEGLENSKDFINEDLMSQISESVDTVINDTTAFYNNLDLRITNLRESVQRSNDATQLKSLFTENMGTMRKELLEGTVHTMQSEIAQGLVNRADMEELILQYTNGQAHYARTNSKLIVSTYNRIGREQVRESADLKHGLYYGDTTDNSRPFCTERVGNVYTLKQIEAMDNEQLSPVKIYAGGYNCIHSWLWVDPEWDGELKKRMVE